MEPDHYSYVRAALNKGYAILTYDRLGVGKSDKPDAYNVVQMSLQVEILAEISRLAKSGHIAKVAQSNFHGHAKIPKFSKLVHIGHSYGSSIQTELLARHPDLADGGIQTGWIIDSHRIAAASLAFGNQFARENDPKKYGDRTSGYVVVGTKSNMQQAFFSKERLIPKLLEYANDIKQPSTIGESVPIVNASTSAPGFKGPLQASHPLLSLKLFELFNLLRNKPFGHTPSRFNSDLFLSCSMCWRSMISSSVVATV